MKNYVFLTLLVLVFPSPSSAIPWDEAPIEYNGKETNIKAFRGKTLVMMFWATWCPHCERQMPQFSLLKNHYMNDPRIEVLAISIDQEGKDLVEQYMQENGFQNLDIVTDANKDLFRSMGAIGVPTIVLVSKEGQVIETYNTVGQIDVNLVQKLSQ